MKNKRDDDNIYDEVLVGQIAKDKFEVIENSSYGGVNPRSSSVIKDGNSTSSRKSVLVLFIIVTVLLIGTAGACSAFALKILELQSTTASLSQDCATLKYDFDSLKQDYLNSTIRNGQTSSLEEDVLHQNLSQSYNSLRINLDTLQQESTDSLAIFQQQNISINVLSELYSSLENRTRVLISVASCATLPPSFPSGHYLVRASNGSAVRVYCDMTRSCGGVTGGWMRVAELDMTNSSHQCPSGLRQHSFSSKRTCTISGTCSSVTILATLEYSKVCGKIKAYQIGSPDAFRNEQRIISDNYVDGISLTYGNPRQHIWTFAAGLDEDGTVAANNCACTNTNLAHRTRPPPAFVGTDYFCDTASVRFTNGQFYPDNPLWDGAGCGPLNTCCSFNNPPWFYKQLPQPTTDDIEMRVCTDNSNINEGIAIEVIEMYIQ